jgi:hypothetical protein
VAIMSKPRYTAANNFRDCISRAAKKNPDPTSAIIPCNK